jgi:hypothetical protein
MLMNKLSREKRAQIFGMMAEGVSIPAIVRLTGTRKNTITKLVVSAEEAFSVYQDQTFRNLPCKRLQLDEIWSSVCTKEAGAPADKKAIGEAGDIWTWAAICTDTKLVPSWAVGHWDTDATLVQRLASRVQNTSDGRKPYLKAIEAAVGHDIDYAMPMKHYAAPKPEHEARRRYSPTECISFDKRAIIGRPDPKHISTGYSERQNLSMRTGMRRFTRLTNGLSKKVESHACAIAIYFMQYNFVRIHQTLRFTPRNGRRDHPETLGIDGYGYDTGRMGNRTTICDIT